MESPVAVYRKLVIIVLLAALGIRLAAGLYWQNRLPPDAKFGFPDSESYWMLAETVARGEPYQTNPDRRVFRTPGYPLLLASLFCTAGGEPPIMWARAMNAVLGVVAVAGVILLTELLFDQKSALLAGIAAAVYPGAISTSTFVLSEAPFCPFMSLHLILWVMAWKAPDKKRQAVLAAGGGVLAGVATLMRPSWLLFVPFAMGLALIGSPRQRVRHAWIGTWLIVGLVAAMSPWWIRNWRVTGSFVPTTLQVGESLYDGLNPQANGASDMRFVDRFRAELRQEDARRESAEHDGASFEQRLDQRMRDAAVAWASQNPGQVVRLAGVKFLRMWNIWPNEPSLRNPLFRVIVMLGYVPLLVLGCCGIWRFAGRGWPYVLCFLPAVYFTCLHVVFIGSIRYRQPAMLLLVVLAAGFIGQFFWREAEPT
jgi:4-amino-4-deoxy-L-arabinose transferase-like glycosyltransferase